MYGPSLHIIVSDERHGRRSIKSNKNSFPRIFSTANYVYIANIVKGEYTDKSKKLLFIWIGCVEPNPIL